MRIYPAIAEPDPLYKAKLAMIEGVVECLDRYGVAGWVYDSAAPDRTLIVSIFAGERVLGRVEANGFRSDLIDAGKGNGRHSFRQAFRDVLDETLLPNIVVKAGGTTLGRASPLGCFRDTTQGSKLVVVRGVDRIAQRVWTVPVTLRDTFWMSSNSILAQITKLTHPEISPTSDRIASLHHELYDVVSKDDYKRLSTDTLSVRFGHTVKQTSISLANTQFIGLDREIGEFEHGYEPEILAIIDLLVPNDGLLLDIGANWGCFPIYLAARAGFSGRAYAFEPDSRSFKDLTKLVEAFELADHIVCRRLGLADYNGVAQLSLELFSGLSSIDNTRAEPHEEICVSRLDDLDLPKANLIKIDVEGFEPRVLRGSELYIRHGRPAIIFENWLYPEDLNKTFEPFNMLETWDYEFFLPCWTTNRRDTIAARPIGDSLDQFLVLCPFDVHDRAHLDERINVLALPRNDIENVPGLEATGDLLRRMGSARGELDKTRERAETLAPQAGAVEVECQRLANELAWARDELDKARKDIAQASADAEASRARAEASMLQARLAREAADRAEAKARDLANQVLGLRGELDIILASRSWLITRPLRTINALVQKWR